MRGVILGAASGEMRSVLGAAANGLRLILQPPVVSARRHAPVTFGPEGSRHRLALRSSSSDASILPTLFPLSPCPRPPHSLQPSFVVSLVLARRLRCSTNVIIAVTRFCPHYLTTQLSLLPLIPPSAAERARAQLCIHPASPRRQLNTRTPYQPVATHPLPAGIVVESIIISQSAEDGSFWVLDASLSE